jgi:hypothetical protein
MKRTSDVLLCDIPRGGFAQLTPDAERPARFFATAAFAQNDAWGGTLFGVNLERSEDFRKNIAQR